MTLASSLVAILKGLQLCLSDKEIRKLAVIPWLIGFVSFACFSALAIHFFGDFLSLFNATNSEGFIATIVYYAKSILAGGLLLIATVILSTLTVLILAGPFQTAICAKVLERQGVALPLEASGIKATAISVARSIFTELIKLLWLLPLGILVFLIGLFPLLIPVAFVIAAWLLAYQFIDIPLDVLQYSARKRFAYAIANFLSLIAFGASLALLWAIPLLGLFLAPAAAAGAAWLVAKRQQSENKV